MALRTCLPISPTISKQILKVVSRLFRTAEIKNASTEKTIRGRLPLQSGPELIILTSEHQFAKTVEIPSRNRFRSFFYFVLLQDASTTLQCITKKKVKKQKGRTTNYITGKMSPNYLALAFDLVTALGVDIHVNLHVMENKQHGSFTYNFM